MSPVTLFNVQLLIHAGARQGFPSLQNVVDVLLTTADIKGERERKREGGVVALTTAGQNTAAVLRKYNGNGTD